MVTSASPPGGQPAPGWEWVSPAYMVLIAIAMALALAIIWWGMRQRRIRAQAEAQQEAAAEAHAAAAAASIETAIAEPAPVASAAPPAVESIAVTSSAAMATEGDELGRMKGIGPKFAARLAELGYTRFAQIAALTPAEANALDAQLGSFRGRLTRDRWIEQATYLANDDRAGFEAAFGRL